MTDVVETLQMGAYHTIDLEMNRKFTLRKVEWDSVAVDRLGRRVSVDGIPAAGPAAFRVECLMLCCECSIVVQCLLLSQHFPVIS